MKRFFLNAILPTLDVCRKQEILRQEVEISVMSVVARGTLRLENNSKGFWVTGPNSF